MNTQVFSLVRILADFQIKEKLCRTYRVEEKHFHGFSAKIKDL